MTRPQGAVLDLQAIEARVTAWGEEDEMDRLIDVEHDCRLLLTHCRALRAALQEIERAWVIEPVNTHKMAHHISKAIEYAAAVFAQAQDGP